LAEDKRLNETMKIRKKRNNFVMIDNAIFNDGRLSWKAKGILGYLLSKPDGWKAVVKDIIKHSKDGVDSVYSGLRELKKYGYYSKTPVKNEKGRITHWESYIYEDPAENPQNSVIECPELLENRASHPLMAFPYMDEPYMDEPYMEKPQHSNTDLSNTDLNKTDKQQQNKKSVVVNESENYSAEKKMKKTVPDITQLSFITELSSKDKAAIMIATNGDIQNIQNAYEAAKQQGGIENLTGWIIHMVGKWQNGEIELPVNVKRQRAKNQFNNFQGREIDFDELERLEREILKEMCKTRSEDCSQDG